MRRGSILEWLERNLESFEGKGPKVPVMSSSPILCGAAEDLLGKKRWQESLTNRAIQT